MGKGKAGKKSGKGKRSDGEKTSKKGKKGKKSSKAKSATEVPSEVVEGPTAAELLVAKYNEKILDSFEVFDHDGNRQVDVRELGTIIRSLGCCPTEADVTELIKELEKEETAGYIRFEEFQPAMLQILLEKKYSAASAEQLLRAFQVCDSSNKGFLTSEEIQKFLTEEGEAFSPEEVEEMTTGAMKPDDLTLHYKDYVTHISREVEDIHYSHQTVTT